MICERRTKAKVLQQVAEIMAQSTEEAKTEMCKQYGLREIENPFFSIPADLYR